MTSAQEFQHKHGEAYSKLVRSGAFQDGMFLLNSEKLKRITILTNDEIANHSREILADLRGHLQHEINLATLHDRRNFDLSDLPQETYEPDEESSVTTKRKRKKD
jgi:hypothetical protein